MPIWLYEVRPLYTALILVALIETVSMVGLMLARRFVIPRLRYHEGANDAVSGTVQAIGVFYGITVGLIAVGVWNNKPFYGYVSVSSDPYKLILNRVIDIVR